jgi:hypothetical protein
MEKALTQTLSATAPLSPSGHINISPKSSLSHGILSPTSFWYLDLTGSGIETHAHIHEPGNARICIMFLAFVGPPRIVRLWGKGSVLEFGTREFEAFVSEHKVPLKPGARSIVMVDVEQCATSCGFSVPEYEFKGHRDVLDVHFAKKEKKWREGNEKEGMDYYWALKSQRSIDGLPGMQRGVEFAKQNGVEPLRKMVGEAGRRVETGVAYAQREKVGLFHLLVALVLGVVIGSAAVVSFVTPEMLRVVKEKGRYV